MRVPGSLSRWLPLKLTAVFVLSVVCGALVTPYVFNLLIWMGRTVPMLESWREILFEKVANRIVMITVVAGAFVMARLAGINSRAASGLPRGVPGKKTFYQGFVLGIVTMLGVLLAAWATGAYVFRENGWGWPFALKMSGNLVGALLVGFVEEWLFRGIFFGALCKAFGVWGAALSSSVLFSLVHFARTENPIGVVHGRWYSAFELMPHMFTHDDVYWPYEGFKMITLFFMGLCLCFFYARHGHIFYIIGLHAGWVWAMRFGDYAFAFRNREVMMLLFGPTSGVSKSGAALLLAVVFTGISIFLYMGRKGNQFPAMQRENTGAGV